MIEVKDAAKKAAEYLKNFFPKADKIQLEEIEFSNDAWIITLSYENVDSSNWGYINSYRNYKQFIIDSSTGNFISMKIREIK